MLVISDGLKKRIKYFLSGVGLTCQSYTAFLTSDGLLNLTADNDRTIHEHYNDFSNYYNEPSINFNDPNQTHSSFLI